MAHVPIESTPVYKLACCVADEVWDCVLNWDWFCKSGIGGQLVRSADSIAANLVEGDGRSTDVDATRFFIYARASAREARHWLRCAVHRKLLERSTAISQDARLVEVAKSINGLISYRRRSLATQSVRETEAEYGSEPDLQPISP
jgi:four helix bundle protein